MNIPAKITSYVLALGLIFSASSLMCKEAKLYKEAKLDSEVVIIGGGIAGALHAEHARQDAIKNNKKIRITILEKNSSISDTTSVNIAPSLTPDEMLSVVPRGKILVEKLKSAFYEPGGIRVDDVAGVNSSEVATNFISQAEIYSLDTVGYEERTKTMLALGKMSMDLWQKMYNDASPELKAIFIASNFNPCCEPETKTKALHEGYRVDLIYNIPNAVERANGMKADYESLGYKKCAILSPAEVVKLDPFLADFCKNHSTADAKGVLQWHNDSVALWRPGGCLDAKVFLPMFYDYLKKEMGTYTDKSGKTRNCFQILYDREVVGVQVEKSNDKTVITGLDFGNGFMKHNDETCKNSSYIFCPGEAVGTLDKLGLQEPAYSGFAGVSLALTIDIPKNKIAEYSTFSHCMEVHQEGIVLAWQARFIDGKIFICVAGTKSFYGDQRPNKDQAFAKDRNLLQFNMVNDVLPEFVSLALGRDTKGKKLTQADLDTLEKKNIARRWAGTRAVVFDGFPTLGTVYSKDGKAIDNAIATTHLGSGGASFGPAVVEVSSRVLNKTITREPMINAVLGFAKANRVAA